MSVLTGLFTALNRHKSEQNTPSTGRGIGFSAYEITQALGRNIMPGRGFEAALSAMTALNFLSERYTAPGQVHFDTLADPVNIDGGEQVSDLVGRMQTPVNSYYRVRYADSLYMDDPDYHTTFPLTIEFGAAKCTTGDKAAAPLAYAYMDTRNKDNIELSFVLWHIGLAEPTSKPDKLRCLEILGEWMDRVDAGQTLDPAACRAELKQKLNLADERAESKLGMSRRLAKITGTPIPVSKGVQPGKKPLASAAGLYAAGRKKRRRDL